MVKANPYISSSNAGEFSPRMDGRVDFDKYGNALSRGLNLMCLPQGGVTCRPGTRFISEVKDSNFETILIPFEPTADQAYMIEAGNGYMRVYRNQGQITALTTTATFATNLPFGTWVDRSTGSATVAIDTYQQIGFTGAANGVCWAEAEIAIDAPYIDQVHVIRFLLVGLPGGTATVQVGSSSRTSDLAQARNLGMGWHTVGFNPNFATSVFVQILNENNDIVTMTNMEFLSGVPVEVETPWVSSRLSALRWAQSGDVKYVFHDDVQPHKIERRGDTSWSVSKAFFKDGPWLGINPDTDLAATNLIKNGTFSNGLGADWSTAVTGTGYVNYNSDARSVFFQYSTTAAGTGNCSQAVTTGAPNQVHVLHFQIVGGSSVNVSVGTAVGNGAYAATTAYNAGWYSVQFTPTASPFYVTFAALASAVPIVGGVAGAYCYNATARLLQPSAKTGLITVTALQDFNPFTLLTDVGRSIRFEYPGREPGWGVITFVTNTQSATVQIYRDLPSTAPLETWRMGSWSDTTGWPHVGTFYQQRLFIARNPSQPQSIWASQSGDFENFQPDSWVVGAQSVQDDDALDFTLAAGVAAPIVWLMGVRRLIVGTETGQWSLASKGAALTPSDFAADPQTSVKALDVAPVTIDSSGLFVQKAQRTIYDLGYSQQIDALKAADMTILSDHIGKANFAQIVYQAEPTSNVWGRLEDGTLACLTYKRDQNVVGWTPIQTWNEFGQETIGVESIATIPGSADSGQVYSSINRDELWMIVNRNSAGLGEKRYIEMMESVFDGPNRAAYTDKATWREAMREAQVNAFYVDCGLTYIGDATTSITGLSHLEGSTVKVVADGAVQADKVVVSGAITLDIAASTVHVGLGYPWVYRGMKLPYGSQTGPSVGQSKSVNGAVLVLRDSASFEYCIDLAGDGDEEQDDLAFSAVPFRRPADAMSEAIPLFSGEVRVDAPTGNGFSSDPRLVMRGTAPLPWTLLGVSPDISESEL